VGAGLGGLPSEITFGGTRFTNKFEHFQCRISA
jgi:hypothetical protein